MPGAVVGMLLLVLFAVGALVHRALRQARATRALVLRGPRAICEEGLVQIGGIAQWISVRGEDRRNPVLVELHGGPGAPTTIFRARARAWEEHFTVVRWEMRGAGRTFGRSREQGQGELTLDRLGRDAVEVVQHALRCTGQRRAILVGNSFGSVIGLRVARSHPELLWAYVGTDQNVPEGNGIVHGYAATLERLRQRGRRRQAANLERMGADGRRWTADDWSAASKLISMNDPRLSRVMRELVMRSLWFSPGHRLRDLGDYARGMNLSVRLQTEASRLDARAEGTRFEVPAFFFQGEHDVLTPVDTARRFLDDVAAPAKQLALIPDATHFAAYWRPDVFLELLRTHVLPVVEEHRRATAAPLARPA